MSDRHRLVRSKWIVLGTIALGAALLLTTVIPVLVRHAPLRFVTPHPAVVAAVTMLPATPRSAARTL
jgi:hypothetical protein